MSVYPGAYTTYWNTRATSPRLVRPFILAGIHITGNPQLPSALQEAQYANRIGSNASFTFVANRNGTVVQCLHPEWQVPWTNGSWGNPNWSLSTVQRAIAQRIGANDSTFLTIENVGYPWGYDITAAQIEAIAKILVWGSRVSGIPINRTTVLGHRDYNSITKYFCPTDGNLNALLDIIIDRAQEIAGYTPVTEKPEYTGPMEGFPVRFRQLDNKDIITTKPGTAVRTRPRIDPDNTGKFVVRRVPKGTVIKNMLGKTTGTKKDGSNVWFVWWDDKQRTDDRWDGRLLYAHTEDANAIDRD